MDQKKFDIIQLVVAILCTLVILYMAVTASTGMGTLVLLTFTAIFAKAVKDLYNEYKVTHSKVA